MTVTGVIHAREALTRHHSIEGVILSSRIACAGNSMRRCTRSRLLASRYQPVLALTRPIGLGPPRRPLLACTHRGRRRANSWFWKPARTPPCSRVGMVPLLMCGRETRPHRIPSSQGSSIERASKQLQPRLLPPRPAHMRGHLRPHTHVRRKQTRRWKASGNDSRTWSAKSSSPVPVQSSWKASCVSSGLSCS